MKITEIFGLGREVKAGSGWGWGDWDDWGRRRGHHKGHHGGHRGHHGGHRGRHH